MAVRGASPEALARLRQGNQNYIDTRQCHFVLEKQRTDQYQLTDYEQLAHCDYASLKCTQGDTTIETFTLSPRARKYSVKRGSHYPPTGVYK